MEAPLIFRPDFGRGIGSGHVMRCLAFAQNWMAGGWPVSFVMSGQVAPLIERLVKEGIQLIEVETAAGTSEDAERMVEIATQQGARRVVLDGYSFNSAYQHRLKSAGLKVMLIDDCGYNDHCCADIIVNQNPHADSRLYSSREPDTRLLLGTEFVLLRNEFIDWENRRQKIRHRTNRVLVTFGGTDPQNLSAKALKSLRHLKVEGLSVILVGGRPENVGRLQDFKTTMVADIEFIPRTDNMCRLMAWADVALSAAGSTTWELAYMGLPSVIIAAAENQRPIASVLGDREMMLNLGWHESVTPRAIAGALDDLLQSVQLQRKFSNRAMGLVDGKGAQRLKNEILSEDINLRPVDLDDADLLLEWANDPGTRAASFSSEPISGSKHIRWLEKKLDDKDCYFFIAVDYQAIPIGQIRFDCEDRAAVISVSIAAQYRGSGLGSPVIMAASRKILRIAPVDRIDAYVRADNEKSRRAFINAGYAQRDDLLVDEQPALHLMYERS